MFLLLTHIVFHGDYCVSLQLHYIYVLNIKHHERINILIAVNKYMKEFICKTILVLITATLCIYILYTESKQSPMVVQYVKLFYSFYGNFSKYKISTCI